MDAPPYSYMYEASVVAVEAGAWELCAGRPLASLIAAADNIALVDEATTAAWVRLSPVEEGKTATGVRATFEDSPELDALIDALNASCVTELSVHIRRVVLLADGESTTQVSACYCPSKALEAILTRLFARLRLRSLRAIYLQSGQQVPSAPLAAFLGSKASAGLQELTLSPYLRTVDTLTPLLDAIKRRPAALERLSLGGRKLGAWDEWSEYGCCACAWFARMAAPPDPAKPVVDEIDRVLQARGAASGRVRRAARAALTPARVLLNARAAGKGPSIAQLPAEILFDVVRACAGDALSDAQLAALCRLARRDEVGRLAGSRMGAVKLESVDKTDPADPDAPGPSSAPMQTSASSPEARAAFGAAMGSYLASGGFWWDRGLPAAQAAGSMSAGVLELYATPAHDALAATFAAPPPTPPLGPLEALVAAQPEIYTADEHGHDLAWGLLAHPERPFLALRARWSSPADLDPLIAALNASRVHELVVRLHQPGVSPATPPGALAHLVSALHISTLHALVLHAEPSPEPPAAAALAALVARVPVARVHLLSPVDLAPLLDAAAETGRVSSLRIAGAEGWEGEFVPPTRAGGGWYAPSAVVARLPAITWRNAEMGRALRRTAAQVLVPARVLLRAWPATHADAAFPVLALPRHVLAEVLRYAASEPLLSDPQLARLCAHAASPTALAALAAAVADAQAPRKVGGEHVPPDAYATLLADAANAHPEAAIAQRIAAMRLRTVSTPTFADIMDRWLAAGGFHVE
ncbi:hypothetical protein Q8F55_000103 [Vanrija albida]|uniref:F-box domain-containing protein n=1 Tax=Vanrija albida TaxID=181172 RepID=A0ABR3QCB5_9TREE